MRADYELHFERPDYRVRVEFNGAVVADSRRVLVLRETRLPPAHYFPAEDVNMALLTKTAHTTHCPFKGNASYWSLKVGDQLVENAAWAYEAPYRDAEPLRGYVSFYPNKVSVIGATVEEAVQPHANPLATWLLRDAWKATSSAELAESFLKFLRQAGFPVDRSTIIMPTLHAQIFATVLVWRADTAGIRTVHEPHDILLQPKFADSPFSPIIRGGADGVRRRLEDPDCALDFPVVRDLHAEGATDYVAMPFRFSDGQVNVMSMTSFAPGGLSTAHLGQIYEVLPLLARMFEVHAQRRTATALLETYLGRHTGERVLRGLVKHGDGEHIHAVIWFCDFRDSTPLSKSLGRRAYLRQLNRFFYCMAGAVLEARGEVLRYIGDAVLAIFPIEDHAAAACERALHGARLAAQRIEEVNRSNPDKAPLRYGIGLHVGNVTYGNIGVPERLEFTVIGAAANEAARVESMTKELKKPVLTSAAFAKSYGGTLLSVGKHALKGLEGEHELFTLRD